MSVAMWNCHTWPLDVSSSVKLSVLRTQCQHWGDISHSLSGYFIQKCWLISDLGHVICQVLELGVGYIWQLIWVPHLKIWTHMWSWVTSSDKVWGDISDSLSGYLIWKFELTYHLGCFIWQVMGGISDLVEHFIWKVDLPKMSCNNNITYYTWQIWVLIVEISVIISVAMWYCPCWLLDVSSNVKLPFLTTICQ